MMKRFAFTLGSALVLASCGDVPAQAQAVDDYARHYAENPPTAAEIEAELSGQYAACDKRTRRNLEACIAFEVDRHNRVILAMMNAMPAQERSKMRQAHEQWRRGFSDECEVNAPTGRFDPQCFLEYAAKRLAWLRSLEVVGDARDYGLVYVKNGEANAARGNWRIARVFPQSGITSSNYADTFEIVGRSVTITEDDITIDGKKCLFHFVGYEYLQDAQFSESQHYHNNWSELGLKRTDNNLSSGYKVQVIYAYCPGTETITDAQRANIDLSRIDENERHLVLVDKHVVFFGDNGGPVVMSFPDAWVELARE